MSRPTMIKICGIKDASILSHALKSGVDFVGFMHFSKSPRHLELAQMDNLINITPKHVKSVVVLVNPDAETLANIMALKPDLIQLHGNESSSWISETFGKSGQKIIKALPVGSKIDLEAIEPFVAVTDHILLDAKPPQDATRPGGLGEAFDWNLLKTIKGTQKFLLGGGLNPGNISKAIKQVKPFGVDVSSGVESAPGVKDAGLITKFVANVRQADKDRARDQQKLL